MGIPIQIPSELVCIILSRVPANLLLRFKCVCKEWRRLISDPYFIKIHTARLHHIESDTDVIHLINRKSIDLLNFNLIIPQTITMLEWDYEVGDRYETCNGLRLILTYHGIMSDNRKTDCWSIRNPLTKDIHYLPPPPSYVEDSYRYVEGSYKKGFLKLAFGFGYSHVADDYKVVRYLELEYQIKFSIIYSLKSNSWKFYNHPFSFSITRYALGGVFCNGALHWIGKQLDNRNHQEEEEERLTIVAFNLDTEDIRFYAPPTCPRYHMELGNFGGCLSMTKNCCIGSRIVHEIWLMNDYGDENSWSKLDPNPINTEAHEREYSIVFYSKSREYLLLHKDYNHGFKLIDLRDNTERIISPPNSRKMNHHLKVFLPSLVQINGGGAKSKRN